MMAMLPPFLHAGRSPDRPPSSNACSMPSPSSPGRARSSSATCSIPSSRNTRDRRPHQPPDPSQPPSERHDSAERPSGPGGSLPQPLGGAVQQLSNQDRTKPLTRASAIPRPAIPHGTTRTTATSTPYAERRHRALAHGAAKNQAPSGTWPTISAAPFILHSHRHPLRRNTARSRRRFSVDPA